MSASKSLTAAPQTRGALVPLVSGLAKPQPRVEQRRGEVDAAHGVSIAAFSHEQRSGRTAREVKALKDLAAWRPEFP